MRMMTALLVFASVSMASPIKDQFQENDPNGSGFVTADVAQTFTVGVSGLLTSFEANLLKFTLAGNMDVDLRTTVGGLPTASNAGGNILASFTLAPTDLPQLSADWVEFDVSGLGINVTAGEMYAIVIRAPGQNPSWRADISNPYSGGGRHTRNPGSSDTWGAADTWDMTFRTFVDPAPIPEPGTFVLFGAAALGAYVIRRRRKAS